MIAVIDYGAGNLGSVHKALKYVGAEVQVTSDPAAIANADKVVLPGVGAFCHCMDGLDRAGVRDSVLDFINSGRPFLGICVGMQMLFDESEEPGEAGGLGILGGIVKKFEFESLGQTSGQRLKVPHIGWNGIHFGPEANLFASLSQGEPVYFVHSYYPAPVDSSVVSATCDYGYEFCCAVQKGNVFGTQFHPEKSGAAGLTILRNFNNL